MNELDLMDDIEARSAADIFEKPLLQKLKDLHRIQLFLCDRLEEIADSLPGNINSQECLAVSRCIYPVIRRAHVFEEHELFPVLQSGSNEHNDNLEEKLERLKFEHWEDESTAEDLSAELQELVISPEKSNIDKISYMLRGFFEGLRRHLAFETEFILPMLADIKR